MLSRSGVGRVVINLGWLGEKIVEVAGNGEKFNLEISHIKGYDIMYTSRFI